MHQTFTTNSAAETEALAQQLLSKTLKHRIVLLSGELGSGKTTFVKGLARALGIQQLIKSPTYTYLNSYRLQTTDYKLFLHFDLYRLPEISVDLEHVKASIGLEEALNNPQALVVVEWPERLPIDTQHLKIEFKKRASNHEILCYTPGALSS
jgi:tRNA threonylcarbamoyladenosine biosynthesis protein TsaE